jgi:hypothetical protein
MSESGEQNGRAPLRKIEAWPHLVSREMLAALAVLAVLFAWSWFIDAPLEEPADPNVTPNPAKAPWYFLGLQELLVYFDPWLAGVVLPGLIVVGLLALPYVDNNVRDTGVYSFRNRRYVISGFLFGLLLWTVLIVIGVWFRGPGWAWYWPWEDQSLHKPLYEKTWSFHPLAGLAMLAAYFGFGFYLPQRMNRKLLAGLGPWRYAISVSLLLVMLLIPIKIVLRLLFGVKYILITPWFNL